MKKIKAFSALILALSMLLLSACGAKQEEGKESVTETEQTATDHTTEITAADREYLESYLADYEAGKFEGEKLFEYERFTEFLNPFEYKGLTYPADPMIEADVTDEEVDDYLTLFLLATLVSDEQYTQITEGVVQKYDVTTIDFRGLVDGKESDSTNGSDQSLVIGSNTFIDGFESGLIGKKVGEEVQLDLKFSPYYHATDVAGKDVTFFVTVKKIQRPAIPELTVSIINEYYKTDFKSIEEAKAWFKQALTVKEQDTVYSCLSAYLQEKILANVEVVQYPEKELQHYADHFMAYHEQVKGDSDWGVYCSEKLGISYEELQKESELYAKEQLKPLLMIYYIGKEEGLTCTTEQIGTFIEGLYTSQNTDGYYPDLKSMVQDCTKLYGADYFEEQVIGAMASEKIIEYAVKEAV